jgi:alpha-L-fucosidase
VNGEAIYATRPWKVSGEGPTAIRSGSFQGNSVQALSAKDIRFTRNKSGKVVYAIALGWPEGELLLRSFSSTTSDRVEHVELLGSGMAPTWQQATGGLRIVLPKNRPSIDYAAALKIRLA